MNKKKIFVVVINWNKKDFTIECLKSLEIAIGNKKNISVVLVDNNSSDGSSDVFKKLKYKFNFSFIQNEKNLGWTGGNNTGIKFALSNGASCIMLLANDSIIKKGAIELLVQKLFSKNNIGIVGPKIYHYDKYPPIISNAGNFFNSNFEGKDLGDGEKDYGQYNKIQETDFVSGTAFIIKHDVFEQIGYFDDRLFIYYEDVDFCLRAKKAGFKCFFEQKAIVYHRGAATTIVSSPLHTYYNMRNRLIDMERYATIKAKINEAGKIAKLAAKYMIRRRSTDKFALYGVRDYLLRRFGERKYW